MAKKKKKKEADDGEKTLSSILDGIEQQYGVGSIMRIGDGTRTKVEAISTGSIGLDKATGIGGLPKGRIVEIYGPESAGKTTLTLHALAEAQALGKVCAFVDAEHALDLDYAEALGVDVENLLLSQPDTGEQALEIVERLVGSGDIGMVVVDSVAALTPKAEIEGEMGQSHMGLQARLMSQAMRKLNGIISRTGSIVIFINQIRMKIGVMFGSPETTTGGNALKFYASMRLDIRRIGAIKVADKSVGNRTRVRVVKNKLAPPFREVEFDIIYGKGISKIGELIDLCTEEKVVVKSGAWYSFNEERIGQGRQRAIEYLEEHPEVVDAIKVAFAKAKEKEVAEPEEG